MSTKRGFTIIELLLAMTFVSILLLAIVSTAIQAGHLYNKGLVIQEVNQAGRNISDVLKRDFLQSNATLINGEDEDDQDVVINLSQAGKRQSGRMCLGGYSYLWNFAEALDEGGDSNTTVVDDQDRPVRLARVSDKGGLLCESNDEGRYIFALEDEGKITHLLKNQFEGGSALAVYSFEAKRITSETDDQSPEALYKISFTIGTDQVSEIDTHDQTCKPPSDLESNTDFCSINNFEMIVRTNG